MKKIIYSCVLSLALGACSTQTILVNGAGTKPQKEEMQMFFVSGLGQTQTIDAAAVCGGANKVAKVERVTSPLNGVLALLTGGIFTPLDAKVYCTQ